MKIGIISDTHGFLDPKVFEYFKEVDEIWHAGDVGEKSVLHKLKQFKPTTAVYGNIDGNEIRIQAPENEVIEREGSKILMTHIASKPPKYNSRVRELIKNHNPNILVCGHSHMLKVEMDKANNLLFINPGAAGRHGFHQMRTLIRFEIKEGKPQNLEVIELGKRSMY